MKPKLLPLVLEVALVYCPGLSLSPIVILTILAFY